MLMTNNGWVTNTTRRDGESRTAANVNQRPTAILTHVGRNLRKKERNYFDTVVRLFRSKIPRKGLTDWSFPHYSAVCRDRYYVLYSWAAIVAD